jgi:predicted metal-dependent hydrolase
MMEDTEMEDAATEVAVEFWLGVEQFNQGQFYDCHDTLEAIWMEATEPQKTFYQGVLQISVALYHLSNQNLRGATILLGEGINRLRRYSPTYAAVNVEALLEQSTKLLVTLQQTQPEQVAELAAELTEERVQANRSFQTVSTSQTCRITIPSIETVD